MKSYLRFDEIVIGEEFGPIESHLSPENIAEYLRDWDDDDPRYRGTDPSAPPLAPITYDSGRLGADLLWLKFKMDKTVVTKTAQRNIRPIRAGERIRTFGR